MNFVRNNLAILIIALVTVAAFIGIISLASSSETQTQQSGNVDPSLLVDAETHIRGEASASATLVEFSDFQCPACGAFYPLVKSLEETYRGQLRVAYKHFPLPQHQFAKKAAEAAEAAGAQGKFWEYHDLLFENQSDLSVENLKKIASGMGLDTQKFNEELDSGKYSQKVMKDVELGNSINVNSTPSFYLNGEKLTLRNADDLKASIDKVLNSQQ